MGRRARLSLAAALALALAACAGAPPPELEPRIVTRDVRVAVPVACISRGQIPPAPVYPDQRISAEAPIDELARAIAIGLAMRDERLAILEAALAACQGAGL